MRGGLLEGKKNTRKGDVKDDHHQFALFCLGKGLPLQIAVRWFYRAIEREREGCMRKMAWDLGKSTTAAGEKSKMTQKKEFRRLGKRYFNFNG
ncbi:hypothetical protein NC652_004777 [Populus alba x Populus x berolinensis]|nr:hypothetical protein NC652_004777 [Populus alba x Populus x berolinensis]